MGESIHRETAKIYQFPIRDRRNRVETQDSRKAADLALVRHPGVDFGSWYHDEAIQDAEQGRR